MEVLFAIVLLWVVPIFVASAIGRSKGRAGFMYGFFLGWLGVLAVAVLPPLEGPAGPSVHRECPHCRELMRRDASVCPHCQRESEAWAWHDGHWWVQRSSGWLWLDEPSGEWRTAADQPAA